MNAKELIQKLNEIAPSIAIETIWSQDTNASWRDAGDWTKGQQAKNWFPWQSEVRATAISNGKLITGHAYLGATWERRGKDPAESNPDISGYLPQMIWKALDELDTVEPALLKQKDAAIALIDKEMSDRYTAQKTTP